MSRGTFGFASTLLNLFVGIPSTLVAISIVRLGIRSTYLIGSAFVCAGSLFLAFATTKPWQFLLGFGVINGIGVCFGDIIPGSTAAARWFERYRGRAVGLVLSGSGVCGFFMAGQIDKLLRAHDGNWRLGWEIVAAGAVLAGIIALLFVKERPEDLGQLPDGAAQPVAGAPPATRFRRAGHAIRMDARRSLPHQQLLARGDRRTRRAISIFHFRRALAAASAERRRSIRRRGILAGPFYRRLHRRPIDRRLADGHHDRALGLHDRPVLLSGRFDRRPARRPRRTAHRQLRRGAIRPRHRLDVHLHDHLHRALLRPHRFSETCRHVAASNIGRRVAGGLGRR